MLRSDERQHLQNQGTPEIVKTQIPLPYELGVFGLFGISAMLLPAPQPQGRHAKGRSRRESGFATPQGGVHQRGWWKLRAKTKKVQQYYCRIQKKALPLHQRNPTNHTAKNLRRVTPL